MASWNEFVRYVRKNYKILSQDEEVLTLGFELDDDRSQLVLLSLARTEGSGEEWLVLESAIGPVNEVDLPKALQEVGEMVCGGLTLIAEDLVAMRHAVPLANLNVNEFESPLAIVTLAADHLEKLLVGTDEF